MTISATVIWFVMALVLGASEVFVGTVYLLVFGLGAFAAGAVAWAGLGVAWQCSAFACFVIAGSLIVHRLNLGKKNKAADQLQNLDVGQRVRVTRWESDATAQVSYRGSTWVAVAAGEFERRPGNYVIRSVEGARLVIEPEAQTQ